MYIILGGTGYVGSATARALLDQGEAVTVVTRTPSNTEELRSRGARVPDHAGSMPTVAVTPDPRGQQPTVPPPIQAGVF